MHESENTKYPDYHIVRYQTNIKNLLNLIQHIYTKTNTLFNKGENENRNTHTTASC